MRDRHVTGGTWAAAVAHRVFTIAFVWLCLVGVDGGALAFGVVVLVAATVVSMAVAPPRAVTPRVAVAGALSLVAFFLVESLESGWDVAKRALSPRLPLSPVLVRHVTSLPEGSRSVFAMMTTLMPGTLIVSTDGDEFLIHALVDRGDELRRDFLRLEEKIAAALRYPATQERHA